MGGIMFIVAIVVVTMISTVIWAFTGADLVTVFLQTFQENDNHFLRTRSCGCKRFYWLY